MDVRLLIPQEKPEIVIEPLQMEECCINTFNRCGLSLLPRYPLLHVYNTFEAG